MNSFNTDERANTDILVFTKRLETLLAPARLEAEDGVIRSALDALKEDPYISEAIRETIVKQLGMPNREGTTVDGLDLLRNVIWQLIDQGLVPKFYDNALKQVAMVRMQGYDGSIRRALQALLALQGFEASLTGWAE